MTPAEARQRRQEQYAAWLKVPKNAKRRAKQKRANKRAWLSEPENRANHNTACRNRYRAMHPDGPRLRLLSTLHG
jgi:hypothetical protein